MAKDLRFPRVNTVIISGRLTREVDLRYTPSGTAVASLAIAFDRSYQKNGEWIQETSYMDVTVWSARGEKCAQELHKGSPVLIEGSLQTRSYVDKDNNNRKATSIVANRINFLEWGDSHAKNENVPADNNSKPRAEVKADVTDDDVPF